MVQNVSSQGNDQPVKKIQVRSGATNQDLNNSNYLTSLPNIAKQPKTYTPMLYTFRIPLENKEKELKDVLGKLPPYYCLLDHTIAVIWILFSPKTYKTPLGIVQLEWALHFLKSIRSSQGDTSQDIKICIERIENLLIDEYAALKNKIPKDEIVKACSFHEKTKEVFSQNYIEMSKKVPQDSSVRVKQAMTDEEIFEEINRIRNVMDDPDRRINKEKSISFLEACKKEQKDRIQSEINKLQSIEAVLQEIFCQDITNFNSFN